MINNVYEFILQMVLVFTISIPSLGAIIWLLCWSIFTEIKTQQLKRKFYINLCEEDKRLIDNYLDQNYFTYRRLAKESSKRLNEEFKNK